MPSPLPSSTLTRAVAVVGDDDVGLAIAVEVRHGQRRSGYVPTAIGLAGVEGAVAVAQQHAHRVVAVIGGDDVGLAVAVQVRRPPRTSVAAGGEGLLGLERAVAVAQQHADGVAARIVGDDDVGPAVAVQVRRPPRKLGSRADGEV